MIDNFEFSDTKQIRKTLLITSFVGICFKILVKNSTGHIEFFGFKLPVEDASIIPYLVGSVIAFEIIALIIRYSDESAREKYKKYITYIKDNNMPEINLQYNDKHVPQSMKPNYSRNEIIRKSVFFLDILFPLILGIGTLVHIFLF